ncbi:MAG: SPASM domain-containing protein, partial [Kofleriaceae bacterium]
SYCGAHSSMYVFDPFGDIYACWERTGDPSTKIGEIDVTGKARMIASPEASAEAAPVPKRKLLPVIGTPKIAGEQAWRNRTFATNDTCLGCKYAFYCGGGCAAEALDSKGEYYTNHCSGFQERFRVAAAETFAEVRAGLRIVEQRSAGCGA